MEGRMAVAMAGRTADSMAEDMEEDSMEEAIMEVADGDIIVRTSTEAEDA
ncbi:MAG: hypothetical protein LBU32_12675 [Clostridiales bacterium]|nr:hypothetical protein [Clostridiales bacterium]